MNSTSPQLSWRSRIGNIILGLLFIVIGLPMALTQHGERSSILGPISIYGPQAVIAGIGFCIWGLIILIYTARRIIRERNLA